MYPDKFRVPFPPQSACSVQLIPFHADQEKSSQIPAYRQYDWWKNVHFHRQSVFSTASAIRFHLIFHLPDQEGNNDRWDNFRYSDGKEAPRDPNHTTIHHVPCRNVPFCIHKNNN